MLPLLELDGLLRTGPALLLRVPAPSAASSGCGSWLVASGVCVGGTRGWRTCLQVQKGTCVAVVLVLLGTSGRTPVAEFCVQ